MKDIWPKLKVNVRESICRFVVILVILSIMHNSVCVIAGALENEINPGKLILIDPGHGGIDGGASGKSGVLEKNLNLIIGKKVKHLLEKEGYKVLISRESDKGLYTDDGTIRKKKIEDLENRLKLKKQSQCDMFVSIHLNAFPQKQYYGAQVWYGDNMESRKLAQLIQNSFRENIDMNNKRVQKPAGNSYRILRDNGTTAAVIVECGFLSNSDEETKLKTDEYQDKIAETIVKAIKLYYSDNKQ